MMEEERMHDYKKVEHFTQQINPLGIGIKRCHGYFYFQVWSLRMAIFKVDGHCQQPILIGTIFGWLNHACGYLCALH
jgi:hypothetical protein